MRRWAIVLVAVLVVIAVAGGSFYGGMAFQRSQQASARQQFFADRGFSPGGLAPLSGAPEGGFGMTGNPNLPGGAGSPARGSGGIVESLEGDTLRLRGAEGEITVRLTDETLITVMAAGGRSDVQPGAQVAVAGEPDANGVITAVAIQIQAPAAQR